MAPLSKNFDFNLRRDHQKISYERRDYESVDDGAHLELHLKNERKTKFRQLRVKILLDKLVVRGYYCLSYIQ